MAHEPEDHPFTGLPSGYLLADPEERITELEYEVGRVRDRTLLVHEIETCPSLSQANDNSDMIQTHPASSDVLRIHLVPFRFGGKIPLKKMSLICNSTSESTSNIGLSLYALDNPLAVRADDIKSGIILRLRKVGEDTWTAISSATGTSRLNLEFERTKMLNSGKGVYYAAWTTDDVNARFFCPNSAPGALSSSKSFRSSFVAAESASTTNGFPDSVTIDSDTATPAAPCVVGRSLVGLRVYGSFTDDV